MEFLGNIIFNDYNIILILNEGCGFMSIFIMLEF